MAEAPQPVTPADGKPFPLVTVLLIVMNCMVFLFVESRGGDPAVVYRYSMIPREVMTGYKLRVDSNDCIHDRLDSPAFQLPLPEPWHDGSLGDFVVAPGPHDVGCVHPDVAWKFGYRTISPATTLFTNMFLHEGWWHLIGNMLFLYIFGSIVESVIGPSKYLLLYVAAGLLSGFASALLVWGIWHLKSVPAITFGLGASGAIAGVIGSYLALHPRADIRIPVPVGPLLVPLARQPAWVGWMFAAAWAGNEVFTALTAGAFAGGVNHLAHLAGFAAGILLVALHESANIIFVALYLFPTAWPLLREFLINRWGT